MKTRPTLVLAAILTSCAFAEIPAKLPEFMNPEQLAKWRAETAAENAAKAKSAPSKPDAQSSTLDVPTPFFTGKPYIESTGTYAFKYRSYNPVLARWTSEDPSGFPDGANGSIYTGNPICNIDYQGLEVLPVTISIPWVSLLGFDKHAQWDGAYRWNLSQREETSGIDSEPGFSGDLPGYISIGDIHYNGFSASQIIRSDLEYRMHFGMQQQRYRVELRVDIYLTNGTTRQLFQSGPQLKTWGEWYE